MGQFCDQMSLKSKEDLQAYNDNNSWPSLAGVDPETGQQMSAGNIWQWCALYGIDTVNIDPTNPETWKNLSSAIDKQYSAVTSQSQQIQILFQQNLNKYNAISDLLTNFLTKYSNMTQTVVGNIAR
jgi:hypothetical protein